MRQADPANGVTVLDGLALVLGSAIASLHVLRIMRSGPSGAGLVMVCILFSLIALTATGPFIFLARRFSRHLPGYPKVGDALWALLGVPWLITALVQSALPGQDPQHNPLFASTLAVGLAVVCLVALFFVWRTWVAVSPEQADRVESTPWTNRVGLILAIAWPLQCGLGMVVLS